LVRIQKAKQLIIIPGSGCSRCITHAKEAIRVSVDTLFIMTCHSEKEFRLMTGQNLNDLPNVYLDREEWATKYQLVKSIP